MSKVVTSIDMFQYVLAGLNKELNGSLEDSEFEELINKAQMEVLGDDAENVEADQRLIDNLRTLVREETLIVTDVTNNRFDFVNPAVSLNGALVIDNPVVPGRHGYFRRLSGKVKFNYLNNKCYPNGIPTDDKSYAWQPLKVMKSNKINSTPQDYYNRPTDDRPYWQMKAIGTSGTVMEVVNNTPSRAYRVFMQYLVHPRSILLANSLPSDIDLPIHMRKVICDNAIRSYLERIESSRTNTILREQSLHIQ